MPLRLCAEMSWSKLVSNARACSRWQSWAGQDVFLSELQSNSLAWPLPVLLSRLVTHCPHTSLWQYRLQLLLSQPAAADNFSGKDMFLQYSRCWANRLSFLWKRNFYRLQGLMKMSIRTQPSLLLSARLREHWGAGTCPTHTESRETYTESGEEQGHIFNTKPTAKTSRAQNRIRL